MIEAEKLLGELIALPSVNPAFLPDGHPFAGERRVAEFLAAVAASRGLEVEFQPVVPGRCNFLARLSPAGRPKQRIILAPHLDTVPPAAEGQLKPRKSGGRLFGRGACDTKGSVAAMLAALLELTEGQRPQSTEIVFAGLVDEENAQAGSRALAASGLAADLAVVGEPTRLQVVSAHKGDVWLELRTHGKSAHSARPELGCNAIYEMARIIRALETDYAASLRRRVHPLLGPATASVGTIQGGAQPNIVPDSCRLTLDRRTLPGETEKSVRREIAGFLKKRKLRATFSSVKLAPCLPLETDPGEKYVRQFLESVGQEQPVGVHYFCDAAVLASGGIPSVVFGPGDIAQAHTSTEWISLVSLERAKDLLLKFLRGLP